MSLSEVIRAFAPSNFDGKIADILGEDYSSFPGEVYNLARLLGERREVKCHLYEDHSCADSYVHVVASKLGTLLEICAAVDWNSAKVIKFTTLPKEYGITSVEVHRWEVFLEERETPP